jgi:ParB family transcriptional regulator, chromosome partitioning protein
MSEVSLKMMAEKKLPGVQKQTQFKVDPRIVEIEPGFNIRDIDREHVDAMKSTLREGEELPPLDVRVDAGRVIVVDGHHRLTAYIELIAEGYEIAMVEARQFRGNDAGRVLRMLTSSQGLPLTPLQQSAAYKRLTAFGWSIQDIAARTGKSTAHVQSLLTLASADTAVQNMVASKEVSVTTAVSVVKKHGSKANAVLSELSKTAKVNGKTKVTKGLIETTLVNAIKIEMEGGSRAELLCPKYAHLIKYLRGTKNA